MSAASSWVPPDPTTTDSRASALLRRAHERHYRWPAEFGGFRATVDVRSDDGAGTGELVVHGVGGSALRPISGSSLPRSAAAEVIAFASRLTAKHHLDLDGRYGGRFRSRLDRPSGTAVVLVGDPRNTVRWIRDGRLVETEFDFLGSRRHVAVLATASAPDGRWLPAVTMERDVRSRPDGCKELVEEWDDLDGVVVPRRRTVVVSGPHQSRIDVHVRDHRLAAPRPTGP